MKKIIFLLILLISSFYTFADKADKTIYFKDTGVISWSYQNHGSKNPRFVIVKPSGKNHTVKYTGSPNPYLYSVTVPGTYHVLFVHRVRTGSASYADKAIELGGYIMIKDTTPPLTPSVSGNPTSWYRDNHVTLTASSKDRGAGLNNKGYQYKVGSGSWTIGRVVHVSSNCTVQFRAIDRVGNISGTKTITVNKIDVSSPLIPAVSVKPSGWTNGNVTLTPSSTDVGVSGVGYYQYRVGSGSWITASSKTVSLNCTVKFRAVDNAGNISGEKSVTVSNIDKSKPSTPSVSGNPSGWTNRDVTLIPGSNDSGSGVGYYQYKIGNGLWTNASSKTVSSNCTVKFRAVDNAGTYSGEKSVTVSKIDKSKPSTPAISGNPSNWTSGNVTLTASSIDIGNSGVNYYQYKINNGVWITGNSTTVSSNCEVKFRSVDRAGNISTEGMVYVSKIDKDSPSTPSVAGNPSVWINTDVTLRASSADIGSGVDYFQYRIGNGGWITGSSITVSSNSRVTFRAIDKVGNFSSEQSAIVSKIDKTAPVLTHIDITDNDTKERTFKLKVFEENSLIKDYYINKNGTGWKLLTITEDDTFLEMRDNVSISGITYTVSENGTYEFKVVDHATNVSNIVAITEQNIDRINPELVIETEKVGEWYSGNIVFKATDPDTEPEKYSVSGIDNSSWDYDKSNPAYKFTKISGDRISCIIDPEIGASTTDFTINNLGVSDNAGNTITKNFSFKFDNKPPELDKIILYDKASGDILYEKDITVENTSSITLPWINKDVKLEVISTDDKSSVTVKYKEILPGTLPTVEELLGLYKVQDIEVSYTDEAGNSNTSIITVRVDKKAPVFKSAPVFKNDISDKQFVFKSKPWIFKDEDYPDNDFQPSNTKLEYTFNNSDNNSWLYCTDGVVEYTGDESGKKLVYFRYKDSAGNYGFCEREIFIDRFGPTVKNMGEIDNNGYMSALNELNITSPVWFDHSGVDNDSLEYVIAESSSLENKPGINWKTLPENGIIPVPDQFNTIEGSYFIHYRAVDTLGFIGFSVAGLEFYVDKTSPEVTGYTIFEKDEDQFREISSGDYSRYLDVYINSTGTDDFGEIIDYSFLIKDGDIYKEKSSNYLFSKYNLTLNNGINYLKIIAIDRAGNRSVPSEVIPVIVDNSGPSLLTISSTTHPEAISEVDSVAYDNAMFYFNSVVGASGIDKYKYKLFKGEDELYRGETDSELELIGLEDNSGNPNTGEFEFYKLEVIAVSGNSFESEPAIYQFRIDTLPPKELTINSKTHPMEGVYYNDKNAVLYWQEPLDLTGIRHYYYQFVDNSITNTEEIEKLKDEVLSDGFEIKGNWSITTRRELDLELISITGAEAKTGEVTLILCAEDWAGVRQLDTHTMLFDLNKPVLIPKSFIEEEIFFEIDSDLYGSSVDLKVSWNLPVDNESGVKQQKFYLQKLVDNQLVQVFPVGDSGIKQNLLADDTSYTIYGLSNEDTKYRVVVEIYDNAGNKASYYQIFNQLGVIDLDTIISIPFDNTFYGYRVVGQTVVDSWAELYLPPALGLKVQDELLEKVSLTLESSGITEFTNGSYTNPDQDFNFEIGGFTFSGTGLNLDDSGLGLTGVNLVLTETEKLLFSTDLLISTPKALTVKYPVTSSIENYSRFNSKNNWIIESESDLEFTFAGERLQIDRGSLPINKSGLRGFDIARDNSSVELTDIVLDSELNVTEAAFNSSAANPFYIETEKYKIKVNNAILRGSKIIVENGEIVLDNLGLTSSSDLDGSIIINDIVIDYDGSVSRGKEFVTETFTYEYEGTLFTADSILFTENGLSVSGYLEINGNTTTFSEHILTKNGLDVTSPGKLDMSITLDDFGGCWFRADNIELIGGNIVISQGEIKLPTGFGNELELTVSSTTSLIDNTRSLIFKASDFSLVQPGEWNIGNTLTSTDYGAGFVLESVKLGNNSGDEIISFPTSSVSFSDFITAESLELKNIELDRVTKKLLISDKVPEHSIKVGVFNYIAKDIYFDNYEIIVDSLVLETDLEIDSHLNGLDFSGFKFNGDEILQFGSSSLERLFSTGGWNLKLGALQQGLDGIISSALLELPSGLGSHELAFTDFILKPGGNYLSGITENFQTLEIAGFEVSGTGIEFDSGVLKLEEVLFTFLPEMGGETVSFNGIELSSTGLVLSSLETVTDFSFNDISGLSIELTKFKLEDRGMLLAGKIFLPDLLQNESGDIALNFTDYGILLKPNGKIETLISIDQLSYELAGITLSAQGINITENGITTDQNTVIIGDILNKTLGSISFDSTGEISIGGTDSTPFEFEPFGTGAITFSVEEIAISSNELSIKANVSLPEQLTTEKIYFDKLIINSDGTVESEATIPLVEFSVMDTDFKFKNVGFDSDKFSIGDATVTFPEIMESKEISFSDITITKEGNFDYENSDIAPFELWGYTFDLDEINFGDLLSSVENGISFTGNVQLPTNFPITELAGINLNIYQLEVPFNGDDIVFQVSINDPIDIKLFDKWDVTIEGFEIDENLNMVINKGSVTLPPEFKTTDGTDASLTIENITLNPEDLTIDVKSVESSNLYYSYKDLDFTIERIKLSQENGLEITKGKVIIPKNDPGNPKFPEGLDDTELNIDKLQIKDDFTVGDLDVSVVKQETVEILNGLFSLSRLEPADNTSVWKLKLDKNGDDVYLAVSAKVILGDSFPAGIRGKSLDIGSPAEEYGFKVNLDNGEIDTFNVLGNFRDPVTGVGLTYTIFDNSVDTGELAFNYIKEDDSFELSVNDTTITMNGSSTPDFLYNSVCNVDTFTINDRGIITNFNSTLTIADKKEFVPGIYMENWKIGIESDDVNDIFIFTVLENGENGNQIELGETFPDGIAGTRSNISDFSIDSEGNIGDIDFNVTLSPELTLFGDLIVRGVTNGNVDMSKGAELSFIKSQDNKDFTIQVIAGSKLSNSLPQGFAGLEIPIRDFTFNTEGEILSLDMGVTGLNVKIYDELSIVNGAIDIIYEPIGTDEIVFDISGKIKMPTAVKNGIGVETFNINELKISSIDGLLNFEGGATGNITTELFAGMSFTFNDIAIGTNGVSLVGRINLPDSFAKGLPDSILLEKFEMDWDGEITDIAAGISSASVKVGGFNAILKNFVIHSDKITMDEFKVSLPQDMGGMKVGFENAGFDYDGDFFGECVVDKIESPDIAGFKIVLYEPSLDIANKKLAFEKVFCKTPDFVGGMEVGINGVQVTPTSLTISGGEFGLPDFTLAGGMGFKGVKVAFDIDGSSYYVKGGASLMAPGLGTFTAKVSFTNPSKTYPIGLEQAYFSWYADGPGIPMGNTGIFLNGIRGGLTFGPPIELPTALQPMFDDGTRIQLGLRVVDATGGYQVRGDADIWLDITDWDWAFRGDITVLNGLATREVIAAITGKGFYGSLTITLAVIKGQVYVYIFDENGQTIVSGDASVKFGLRKGALFNKKIFFKRVRIPSSDTWLAKGSAQFGRFKKGSGYANGVKGSIDISWFNISAFVDTKGKLDLKGADKYKLYTPFSARSRSNRTFADEQENSNVVSFDTRGRDSKEEILNFRVPDPEVSLMTRSGRSDESHDNRELENLVFMVVYPEGDPELTAISAGGEEFSMLDPKVIVDRTEWGMFFIVSDPEPGEWTLKVDNMPSPNSYDITVFGNRKAPELNIDSIGYDQKLIVEPYNIKGSVTPKIVGSRVEVFAKDSNDSFTGYKVSETVTDQNGEFTVTIDPQLLDDGESFIYVNVNNGEGADLIQFVDGSFLINNTENQLPAVENLLISENEIGDLVVSFDKLNNSRVKEYRLFLTEKRTGEELDYNLGLLNNFNIPGLLNSTYIVSVAAIDTNGNIGLLTPGIEYTIGEDKKDINDFTIIEESILAETTVGESVEAVINIDLRNPQKTDSSYDYIIADIERDIPVQDSENLWNIYPRFELDHIDISSGAGRFNLKLSTNSNTIPGTYNYNIVLNNMGNRLLTKEIPLTLVVLEPSIAINGISPDTWEQGVPGDFEIYGEGFVDGSRVLVNGIEIPTKSRTFGKITAAIPETFNKGDVSVQVISGINSQEVTVEAIGPTWTILSYKGYSEVTPGGKTSLFYTIKGMDGFNGIVPFHTENLPDNWGVEWDGRNAQEDYISSITVTVPEDTIPGIYLFSIKDTEDNLIPIEILVTDRGIKPTISSLSSFSILQGEEISIFGFGFDKNGEVYIGEQLQEIVEWGTDRITIKTNPSLISGDLKVIVNGVESNTTVVNVKDRGFKIYPQKDHYRMQPGESIIVPVAVSGHSDAVSLELENQNEYITAYLDDTYVALNGYTNINISLAPQVTNGIYPVIIKGSDGYTSMNREITIQVGEAYSFTTEKIPPFMEGVTSSFTITTEHGDGKSTYAIEKGDILPSGLSFSRNGEISGKASYGAQGRKVTIIGTDESGREISRDYEIVIEENSWPLSKKNGGHSGFNPTPSPADKRIKWNRNAINSSREIIVSNNRVFVMGTGGIAVLDANSGTPLYTIDGYFTSYFCSSETLFTLDHNGVFTAWEVNLGNKKWARQDIIKMSSDGFRLLLEDSNGIKDISIEDGQLIDEFKATLSEDNLWFRNRPIKSVNKDLLIFKDGDWVKSYSVKEGSIAEMVSDDESIIILTNGGELLSLNKDLELLARNNIALFQGDLVLTDKSLLINDNGDTAIINRETLDQKQRFTTQSGNIVSAKEKFFIVGDNGLEARNIYNGNLIWSVDKPQQDIAIVGEELFALEADGTVVCYNGRDNIYAPSTIIVANPAEPGGRNGYYVRTPEVEVISSDPETFVKEVNYKYDQLEMSKYSEKLSLPDGEYSFVAYGVDSNNLRGLSDVRYFKIDTAKPESTIVKELTEGLEGYTTSETIFKLSATDQVSGVEDIYYTLDGETRKYIRPVYVNTEGEHSLTWWSEDIAGNIEEEESFFFNIDLYKPKVRHEIYQDAKTGVVYMFADDSSSGINRIEYMVNGSEIAKYTDPVNLKPGELYNVTFRAVDNAGHMSDWENIVLDMTNVEPVELIRDFSTTWGISGRYINKDLQVGDDLYVSNSRSNKIEKLPDYLVGGHMITGKYNDKYSWERNFYQFEAGADIDLYIVKNRFSQLKLDKGWTKIVSGIEISNKYFNGGADIYHKAFNQDDDIVIGGTAMWQRGGPNLIIAQRSLSDKLNIFSPNPDKDLYPLSKNWFAATNLKDEINRFWTYRIGDGEWIDLGSKFSGSFDVPYIHNDSTLELRVQVKVKNGIDQSKTDIITKTKIYNLRNLSKVDLTDPVSGSQVLLNTPTPFNYSVLDIEGKIIETDVLWSAANGKIADGVYSPKTKGLSKITGIFNTFEDWAKEFSVTVNVVDNYQTEVFNFNRKLTGCYKEHSDSRFYGFVKGDATNRLGETTYVIVPKGEYWSNNRETRMYIALEKDNPFEYLVNNGFYRIKATVGPVRRKDSPYIKFEDDVIDINASYSRKIYTIETSVKVEDNRLTLSGSENLQVISLEILRIDKPIETAVTSNDTYRIIKDMKWYRWNPDHYYH